MPLEGVGGLILASLPAVTLLIASPAALVLWVAAGALLAPAIHWGNHRDQSRSNLGGGIVAFCLALLFAVLPVGLPALRGVLLPWSAACLLAAAAIHWRARSEDHPTIRAYAS
jgi:hypothetical protein